MDTKQNTIEQWMRDAARGILIKIHDLSGKKGTCTHPEQPDNARWLDQVSAQYAQIIASHVPTPAPTRKPKMTFGEWCDMNVVQPTVASVELYASYVLAEASSPTPAEAQDLAHQIALALYPPTEYCTDNAIRAKAEGTIKSILLSALPSPPSSSKEKA